MIDLAIFDVNGRRISLPTPAPRDLSFTTGRHGYQDLTAFLPLPDAVAAWLVTQPGLRVLCVDGPALLWEGRAEDLALVNGGVRLGGLGDWAALDDDRYTALWSDSSVTRWRVGRADEDPQWRPAAYDMDTNNRIYITPRKGEIVGSTGTGKAGVWLYDIPHRSTRQIVAMTFDYVAAVSAGWTYGLATYSVDPNTGVATYLAAPWSGTGPGGPASVSVTFAGCDRVIFYLRYTGADLPYPNETGAEELRIYVPRVKTTTGAVTADLIARDIRDRLNLLNPGALSASDRRIVSPGLDLTDALYEDASPQDVLASLAELGDGAGGQFETGVWEGAELHFRPAGSGATAWAVDAGEVEIAQSLDGLVNSTYAAYEDANDRALRTANQVNATSIARYGRTRRRKVDAKTTSAALAATIAATATAATAVPVPRARLSVRRFASAQGAPVAGHRVRAGDVVSVRNLSPAAGDVVERVRTFRVAETSYSADDDAPEISPEDPAPDLAAQLALVLRRAGVGQ